VSSALKPIQQKNVELDKKKQVLAALNIFEKDAEAAYNTYVKADQLLNADGTVAAENGGFAVENAAVSEAQLPLYVCEVEGETKYVLPLYGAGLWGPIWGYVALNADKETIYGVYFSHAGETPGLGAEITNRDKFQVPFIGKKALNAAGDVVISVVKNGKVQNAECEVDGISGGTITSYGVNAMLKDGIGLYKAFLTKGACAAKAECSEHTECAEQAKECGACPNSVPAAKIEVVNQ
jgi:Na+-transporting NADH:ubiquinone oxidoreductase subunit C